MQVTRILSIALCAFGLLTIQACKKDADVHNGVDTTMNATGNRIDSAASSAGREVASESIEKKVESKLVLEPGFAGVHVESTPEGMIILTGTATENEKARAQVIAQNTDGVKGVTNNITVTK